MNRGKTHSLWSHVQSMFGRQQYSGVPSDGRRDHDEPTALEMQPSTFALTSFSSKIQKPRASFLRSSPESIEETHTLIHQTDGRQTTTEVMEDGDSTTSPMQNTWIVGVRYCAAAGACILVINLIFIIVAAGISTRYNGNSAWGDSAVIYDGDCGIVKRWSLGLHLIINILSTLILAASNYCMQTLVAPTREEVDAAHARGQWLDIGGASIRNLLAIGRGRLGLWIILMLTASPFHLMYNSMVFESFSNHDFRVFVAPKDMNSSNVHSLGTPALEKCFAPEYRSNTLRSLTWNEVASEFASDNYEPHKSDKCSSFGSPHSGIKALALLTDDLTVGDGGNASVLTASSSPLFVGNTVYASPFAFKNAEIEDSIECIDGSPFSPEYGFDHSVGQNYTVNECLVMKVGEHCQLLYSPPICIAIALAAFAKVVAMFLAARVGRNRSPPLLTIGDAISSFILRPDPTTNNLCWLSSTHVREGAWTRTREASAPVYRSLSKPGSWSRAVTRWRWIATLSSCFLTLITGIVMFFVCLVDSDGQWISTSQFKNLFSSDVDESDYYTFHVVGVKGMLQSVVFANIPQLAVTICYYCYNAVLTSMVAAAEYSSYGIERKALRVTWPIKSSQQRSTYWLSIPYRYSVPVLLLYMTLHWTISQSIFYLEIVTYTALDQKLWSTSSLGYSSTFILFSTLVGVVMMLTLCILRLRRLKSNAPLAASCSAAISAACHPPTHENLDAAIRGKLKWGQTTSLPVESINSEGDEPGKGHCSFTSSGTVEPTLTKRYA
ncbi:hypothetical protein N7517_007439 [Penicillium concentricum]|uniref:DUF6536 domain-containing protein n=1 Tax=Penicillium concentricum TaxID=293559 RepID=A0A9W9SFX9_9EURO|nr:uncharacterized protein N7517_007439 [Penicillium concentricum]KAJ5375433.1 hypothetical protein N7517_007439 [Penicillium concentricum]